MKHKLFWSVILGTLAVGLAFTSVTLAATHQPQSTSRSAVGLFQTAITPTATPTGSVVLPTATVTPTKLHPVASALAEHFGVPYEEIAGLHQQGLGFGVIARAYFMAENLDGVTADDLMAEFESGLGWGQIARSHDLHPGRGGRGGSVGVVMSGRGQNSSPSETTESLQAHPGNGHGPPDTPPGQEKKKNKENGNGNGRNK